MVQRRHGGNPAWFPLVVSVAVTSILFLAGCSGKPAPVTTPAAPSAAVQPVPAATGAPEAAVPVPTAVAATATPVPSVAATTDLGQSTTGGKAIPTAGWTVGGVMLSFRSLGPTTSPLIPQVEVVKSDQPFTGNPTVQGQPLSPSSAAVDARVTLANLVPGEYKWQARFEDAETRRLGVWSGFAGGDVAFGVAGSAPSVQQLMVTGASQTSAGVVLVSQKDQPSAQWSVVTDQPLALDQVRYLFDHQVAAAQSAPSSSTALAADARSLPIDNLSDGDWYLHVWAVDKAGQSSAPATVNIRVMREPLSITDVLFRSWATNPLYQTVPISFDTSRDATVTVSILPATSASALRIYHLGAQSADKTIHLSWDGKDSQGKYVGPGTYRFLVDAVDQAGNDAQALYNGINITDKVIKVTLSTQSLTAYEGDKPFVTTLVTTGGADIPTPVGQFEILEKSSPFTFHSPFPKGNKFWYPDVTSHYAMLFDQPDADFIHDAPWRNRFGPGTNGPGVPGQVYTGSHGCVETPASVMPGLYPWTPLGTPVIVSP